MAAYIKYILLAIHHENLFDRDFSKKFLYLLLYNKLLQRPRQNRPLLKYGNRFYNISTAKTHNHRWNPTQKGKKLSIMKWQERVKLMLR